MQFLLAFAFFLLPADLWAGHPLRYAVVVSGETQADPEWSPAVEALRARHKARVFIWKAAPEDVREGLAAYKPRYVCFVCRPRESGREFVARAHRLTRALDDDPYGDAVWAILTGYNGADALRIAKASKPLRIRRGLAASAGGWLDYLREGVGYSESSPSESWIKKPNAPRLRMDAGRPVDTTASFVKELNSGRTDMFWTSGHASEHDWQIGYSYRNGQFRHKNGRLFGLDLQGRVLPIVSPNPKVYFAPGNCLIGRIDRRDCMATSWIHSGGADMLCGYTVDTWYGFMGWGISDYFFNYGNEHTFAEAFFFNNQAIVFGLTEALPDVAGNSKNSQGHRYDLDAVALYGDPAWDVRAEPQRGAYPFQTSMEAESGDRPNESRIRWTLRVLKTEKADSLRPAASWLPFEAAPVRPDDIRLDAVHSEIGSGEGRLGRVVVTKNFILVQLLGELREGDRYTVSFPVRRARSSRESSTE